MIRQKKRAPQVTYRLSLTRGGPQWEIDNEYGYAHMIQQGPYCRIENLEIRKPYRKLGHGSRFLTALELAARRAGALGVTLQAGSADEGKHPKRRLVRFYLARGYAAVPGHQGWERRKTF